ncbi:MAG: response regulator [Bacteroidota bacterium]
MKVMVVDDSSSVRSLLRMILAPLQCELAECEDGSEAVKRYPQIRPDLVLMDIEMPVMDGFTATELLISGDPSASVIMMSQYSDPNITERSLQSGAKRFISKDMLYHLPEIFRTMIKEDRN